MGRRMKATKSGKFINPTDQARKEARKRELRKNKKQRLIVRTAVLKGKDPFIIISDLERLDKMEFDLSTSSALNEKVLKDKRRKLKETWDRLCRLYVKDDKDKYLELKRIEAEYDLKRGDLVKQFEAVKSAQEVSLEDIPLPTLPMEPASGVSNEPATSSILKPTQRSKIPPGCPQGPPPALLEFEIADDDSESDHDEELKAEASSKKKIRFSDEAQGKDKDSNLKDFLKEIEQLSGDKDESVDNVNQINTEDAVSQSVVPPMAGANPFYPNQRVQPAPPITPSIPTQHVQIPIRPNIPFVAPRMPIPQNRLPMPPHGPQIRTPAAPNSNSYMNYTRKAEERRSQVTTIEAKPQLRNLSADSTKFMPLALRVKRDDKQTLIKKAPKSVVGYGMVHSSGYSSSSNPPNSSTNKGPGKSKDQAYDSFMKEMQGLM